MKTLKKLFVFLLCGLLSIIIFSLLLYATGFSFNNITQDIFGDIYDYSSLSSQHALVSKLNKSCGMILLLKEAQSQERVKDFENICEQHANKTIGNKALFIGYLSGSVNLLTKNNLIVKNNEIPFVRSALNINTKINRFFGYKILLFVLLVFLLSVLFFIYSDNIKGLLLSLGSIFLNVSLIILAPFIILKIYIHFNPIDTSFII